MSDRLEIYTLPLYRFHWTGEDGEHKQLSICAKDFWKACDVFRVKAPDELKTLRVGREHETVIVRVGDDGEEPEVLDEGGTP